MEKTPRERIYRLDWMNQRNSTSEWIYGIYKDALICVIYGITTGKWNRILNWLFKIAIGVSKKAK